MPVSLNRSIVGDGPPLLVLHGLFGSSTNWRSIAKALANRWQVHLLDQRNHGQSAHVESMSYPEMAKDLMAYMDASSMESAVVMGHSMGGKVAMRAALEWPNRIHQLVVVDIAPTHSAHDHLPFISAMENLRLDGLERREQASRALAEHIPDQGLRQFLLQNLVTDRSGFRWRINLSAIKDNLPALHDFPVDGTSGRYAGPALFVRGQKSDYVPDDAVSVIREMFENPIVVTVNDAGHWPHAERPAEFLKAVEDFLNNETP